MREKLHSRVAQLRINSIKASAKVRLITQRLQKTSNKELKKELESFLSLFKKRERRMALLIQKHKKVIARVSEKLLEEEPKPQKEPQIVYQKGKKFAKGLKTPAEYIASVIKKHEMKMAGTEDDITEVFSDGRSFINDYSFHKINIRKYL